MPLAHESQSHGTIVFGFYNIETDALMLDRWFFFATDFCRAGVELAAKGQAALAPAWQFNDPGAIGDLMGAIHGLRHIGYLGQVYLRWPFPAEPEQFRQRLNCAATRGESEVLLARHAAPGDLAMSRLDNDNFAIGPYQFTPAQFQALAAYVRRGGWPTWENYENGGCPDYAAELALAWGIA
jgi:hypothetical protein